LDEIEVTDQLEFLNHLRHDGENQMIANLRINGNRIVGLIDTVDATNDVNKRT